MASPTRFPRGLATFNPKSVMGSYPIGTSPAQIALTEDFIPYRAGDYTVTTAVAGTIATFAWLSGAIRLATSASGTDTIYAMRLGAAYQAINGNQFWMDFKVVYPRSVNNANDTNAYFGWFNNAVPTAATDGIYFFKPTGGTAVHFVIRKNSVSTTFQNVADLAVASGLFGDTAASNATLTAVVAGNAFTGISIATPGSGYQTAPMILTTAASGVAGNVPVFGQLGSTAYAASSNPQSAVQSTGLPYGSIAAPQVINAGSGYTNNAGTTTYLEVEPVIDLQAWFDGKGRLVVGVNGRAVLTIEGTAVGQGRTGVAAGATVNVATTGPSYASTTQLTTALMPFQPPVGSPVNLLPTVPLNIAFGFANTTANIRSLFVLEYNAAIEFN